ncbi:MAG: hypothetical protein RL226_1576 [Bacteroidota bacterium]
MKNLLLTFLLIITFGANATDYMKEFKKSFETTPNVSLSTHTSFGKLKLIPWDKNEVDILVQVIVDAGSEKDAEEIFDRINLEIRGTRDQIEIQSEIGNGSWRNKNGNFEINITVHAPEKAKMDLDHSFGDLDFGAFEGKAKIDLSYGHFSAQQLIHPDSYYNMSYSNTGLIQQVQGGTFNIEFGGLSINKINGNVSIDAGYSSIDIKEVTPQCREFTLDNSFGSAEIGLNASCNFAIEASASFGSVDLPSGIKVTTKEKDMNSSTVSGTVGSGGGEFSVNCSFGDVDISFQ